MLIEPGKYKAIERVCFARTYRKTGINRLEITFLLEFQGYLNFYNKVIASEIKLLNFLSGKPQERIKLRQYLFHCQNKKLIGSFEYIKRPGSKCIGFSDYGAFCLNEFYSQLNFRLQQVGMDQVAAIIPIPILNDMPYYKAA
jgi:hypothetical protein